MLTKKARGLSMDAAIPSLNHSLLHEYGACYCAVWRGGGAPWSPHMWQMSNLYPRLAPILSARVAAEVRSGGQIFSSDAS